LEDCGLAALNDFIRLKQVFLWIFNPQAIEELLGLNMIRQEVLNVSFGIVRENGLT
jgi:hypothetical protein